MVVNDCRDLQGTSCPPSQPATPPQTPVNYSTTTPLYGVLLWGGIGISLGMVCCGSRVIETMGSKISRMTPSLGFTVVLTASVVVMVCSMAGIPTSTTHCQVTKLRDFIHDNLSSR